MARHAYTLLLLMCAACLAGATNLARQGLHLNLPKGQRALLQSAADNHPSPPLKRAKAPSAADSPEAVQPPPIAVGYMPSSVDSYEAMPPPPIPVAKAPSAADSPNRKLQAMAASPSSAMPLKKIDTQIMVPLKPGSVPSSVRPCKKVQRFASDFDGLCFVGKDFTDQLCFRCEPRDDRPITTAVGKPVFITGNDNQLELPVTAGSLPIFLSIRGRDNAIKLADMASNRTSSTPKWKCDGPPKTTTGLICLPAVDSYGETCLRCVTQAKLDAMKLGETVYGIEKVGKYCLQSLGHMMCSKPDVIN